MDTGRWRCDSDPGDYRVVAINRRNLIHWNHLRRDVGQKRDDLDSFLETGFTETRIYSPTIRFREAHSNLHLQGLQKYLMAATLFRGLVLAYFDRFVAIAFSCLFDPVISLTPRSVALP